jgi:hypothetical protein
MPHRNPDLTHSVFQEPKVHLYVIWGSPIFHTYLIFSGTPVFSHGYPNTLPDGLILPMAQGTLTLISCTPVM